MTTASDVYALGILLYELVTGVRPYETQGLTLDRVLDLVIHTEPARPSSVAAHRHLRGDIDAIVLKAISKEAAKRYDSAGELGSDVARFLAGEPVLARGPSTGYVLRRLAARNKTVVAVSALALLAIVSASGVALWQRQIARREQARAEQRFREVRQLANALIFKVHDAVAPLAGSTPVRRTIVDEALSYLERLEREAGADDVTLRLELAAAYRQIGGILGDPQRPNLGDREGAIRQYERARAIILPLRTTAHYDVIIALSRVDGPLSTLYSLKNDQVRSLDIAREAVDHAARFRQRHPADIRGLETLAAASFHLAWRSPRAEQVELWKAHPRALRPSAGGEAGLSRVSAQCRSCRKVSCHRVCRAISLRPITNVRWSWTKSGWRRRPIIARRSWTPPFRLQGSPIFSSIRESSMKPGGLLERSLEIRRRLAATDPANVQARALLGSVLTNLARVEFNRGGFVRQISCGRRRADVTSGARGDARPLGAGAACVCVAGARAH